MFNWLTYRILAYIAAGLGAVIVGLSIALWAKGVQVGHMKNERDAAVQRVSQALLTIDGQKKVLQECSNATKALEQAGAERQARADEALSRLRKEADRYIESNKRLAKLVEGPTPAGAGCSQALVLVRRELRK